MVRRASTPVGPSDLQTKREEGTLGMALGLAPLHPQSPLKLSEAGGTRTKS